MPTSYNKLSNEGRTSSDPGQAQLRTGIKRRSKGFNTDSPFHIHIVTMSWWTSSTRLTLTSSWWITMLCCPFFSFFLSLTVYALRKKGTKAVTGAVPFQKYLKGAYWYLNSTY